MHPASVKVTTAPSGTLPADLTSFVGRRQILDEIRRMFTAGRLVTLTGMGGVGKTRLALRAGGLLRRAFRDGVWLIDLSVVKHAVLVPQAAISALGVEANQARPPLDVLVDHLRQSQALLIVDNCEHLVRASADLVATLLRAAPDLRVLATSRQALGVPGERLLTVPPLAVPPADAVLEPGAVTRYSALALFAERAAAVVPGFQITPDNQAVVAQLCRQLDGMPLAIELAAVRLRVLPVTDIAARLTRRFQLLSAGNRMAPPRHQTLWATIDWSYDLCTPAEQTLWARASVFVGGFDLQAVEAVCSDEMIGAESILDTLAGLVDKSILLRLEHEGRVRFDFLEMLREFGHAKLSELGAEAEIRARHRDWYRQLIVDACAMWFGPDQKALFARLRLEQPNVRAALEYCLREPAQARVGLRIAGRAFFLWHVLFLTEGRQWLERLLEADTAPSSGRAWALATCGTIAAVQGDVDAARELLAESEGLAARLGDAPAFAYARAGVALSVTLHEPLRSLDVLLEAVTLNESIDGADDVVVQTRLQLGAALIMRGDTVGALEQFERCQRLCEARGERLQLSWACWGLSFVSLTRGDLGMALEQARMGLVIKRELRDLLGQAVILDLMAWTHAALGNSEMAAVLLGGASRLWRTIGQELFGSMHWKVPRERAEQQARRALGGPAFDAAFARGQQLSQDDLLAYALDESPAPSSARRKVETPLTPREQEIAALIGEGLTNKEIAQRLVISQRTAEGHVENILAKLGFTSRAQIASWLGRRSDT
jgi:predicted ATPase/DNA-binding CsgD family transcriptional regulator